MSFLELIRMYPVDSDNIKIYAYLFGLVVGFILGRYAK